jgi:hypothetical protein
MVIRTCGPSCSGWGLRQEDRLSPVVVASLGMMSACLKKENSSPKTILSSRRLVGPAV